MLLRLALAAALALPPVVAGCGGGADAQGVPVPLPAVPSTPPVVSVGPAPFGPAWVTSLTPEGVGWTGCSTYAAPQNGSGCFIQFLVRNQAGTWLSGVTLNGGLVDIATGREQGDLDVTFYVDGVPKVIAVTGRWQGAPAGLLVSPSDELSIGGPNNRWKDLALTEHPCPPQIMGSPSACVSVNGGSVPLWR